MTVSKYPTFSHFKISTGYEHVIFYMLRVSRVERSNLEPITAVSFPLGSVLVFKMSLTFQLHCASLYSCLCSITTPAHPFSVTQLCSQYIHTFNGYAPTPDESPLISFNWIISEIAYSNTFNQALVAHTITHIHTRTTTCMYKHADVLVL